MHTRLRAGERPATLAWMHAARDLVRSIRGTHRSGTGDRSPWARFLLCLPLATLLAISPASAQVVDDVVVVGNTADGVSRWRRAESRHFILYRRGDDRALIAIATELERFDALVHAIAGTVAPEDAPALSVVLVSGRGQIGEVRRLTLPVGTYATGYYTASARGEVLVADTSVPSFGSRISIDRAWLFTEQARRILSAPSSTAAPPLWFVDGAGIYLSTVRIADDTVEVGRAHPMVAALLAPGKAVPSLRRIIAGDVTSGQDYSAACALLAHYILSDARHVAAFTRFLSSPDRTSDPVAAFARAFALPPRGIDRALLRYVGKARSLRVTGMKLADPAVTVSSLPRSADDLLLTDVALTVGGITPGRGAALLARVRSAAADRPADLFAARLLAKAEVLVGDPAAADAPLDALLARSGQDSDLLYWKGMRYLAAGRTAPAQRATLFGRARAWLDRALQADPANYAALYRLAEARQTLPDFVSAASADLLLRAARLAPNATQLRLSAVDMLMLSDRSPEAAALLRQVVVTPRDPLSGEVAGRLRLIETGATPSMQQLLDTFAADVIWRDLNCC